MQQHSLQHRALHYLPSCSSFISAYCLEEISVRCFRPALIRRQKWYTNHHPDLAECLCRSQFLVRKASQTRRICFFSRRSSHAFARVLVDGEVGQTTEASKPRCMNMPAVLVMGKELAYYNSASLIKNLYSTQLQTTALQEVSP